jgi:hypothetical protein
MNKENQWHHIRKNSIKYNGIQGYSSAFANEVGWSMILKKSFNLYGIAYRRQQRNFAPQGRMSRILQELESRINVRQASFGIQRQASPSPMPLYGKIPGLRPLCSIINLLGKKMKYMNYQDCLSQLTSPLSSYGG